MAIRDSSRWSTVLTDTLGALQRARRALAVRLVPSILQQQCDNAMSRDRRNRPVAHRDPNVSVCPEVLYMYSRPLALFTVEMDRQAYANRILATGAEPRRLGQLEEHGGSGVERVDLHTHPKKITFNYNPHPHLRGHTYQHDDSTILRLSTPVLCRVSWIAGPIVRLTSSGRVHDSAIHVDSHV